MKKLKLTIILCLLTLFSFSQENNVKKNTNGIQIGLYGLWAYNEVKIVNNTVLRSEIGTDLGFGKNFFIANPTIAIEPKWYYNINKRHRNNKNITNNSANFISLQTKYYFDNITNRDSYNRYNQDKILKSTITWGIRRNISNTFNYEAGIGIGGLRDFGEGINDIAINVHLRIGLAW